MQFREVVAATTSTLLPLQTLKDSHHSLLEKAKISLMHAVSAITTLAIYFLLFASSPARATDQTNVGKNIQRQSDSVLSQATIDKASASNENSNAQLGSSFSSENSLLSHPNLENKIFIVETAYSVGMRKADFDWSIASDFSGANQPNTLSELKYHNLKITEVGFDYQVLKQRGKLKGFYFESHISAGYMCDGVIQDSDYDGDNRSQEFSRSLSDPEGSFTFNFVNAIGISKRLTEWIQITPLLGYSYNTQNFVIKDGEQVVATLRRTPSLGRFNGLNSSYQAEWFGFWFGVVTKADLDKHHFTLRSQYHLPEYYAEADWNLRSDFAHPKSFAHFADGDGFTIELNYAYQLSKSLKLTASYQNERWKTRDGIDTIFFADGDTASTKLNQTNWASNSLNVGILLLTD